MKRIILSVLMVFAMSLTLGACGGDSSYAPKELAAFNNIYKADKPASDGSSSIINIASAKLSPEGNIIIDVGAPLAQEVAYAYSNFLAFEVMDASGSSLTVDNIAMNEGDHQTAEVVFTLKGSSFSDAKYVKIIPYKTGDGNPVIYELQK